MSDWKIRKRKDACLRCEREFDEEEVFYSFLLLEGLMIGREDRCVACFDPEEVQREEAHSIYWRTRRPPDGKRRIAVDFDVVEQIFFALADHSEERILELRYLMSLLLLRKKRLKIVRLSSNEEGETMILRRTRRTEAIEVRVFDLSEERSEQLRAELARIFEGAEVEDLLAAPAELPIAPEVEPESPPTALEEDPPTDGGDDPQEVDSHATEESPAS